MLQHVGGGAAGVFQRVGEDRQVGETAVGVDGLRQGGDGSRAPGGIERDGAEGVSIMSCSIEADRYALYSNGKCK